MTLVHYLIYIIELFELILTPSPLKLLLDISILLTYIIIIWIGWSITLFQYIDENEQFLTANYGYVVLYPAVIKHFDGVNNWLSNSPIILNWNSIFSSVSLP
jgi:nitrogen fixation-related uncharacterized protein